VTANYVPTPVSSAYRKLSRARPLSFVTLAVAGLLNGAIKVLIDPDRRVGFSAAKNVAIAAPRNGFFGSALH
jgi:hypothetical protein